MSESAASCDLPLRLDIFSWTLPNSITELSSLLTTAHDGSGHPYLDQHPVDWVSLPRKIE
ncbi:hypothetical protein PGT21_029491 [Puccinia graminis f. sp. tritici]|uniref:Uncharacterized protein n=1 Tax=Puccinia graminis f. sp. tritici TaxID=56615 RepID=A0A5B0MP86_PUCGR|nr:hypothetical protein PGT21_029491 [Puccinia graminis f. sp. tritici]